MMCLVANWFSLVSSVLSFVNFLSPLLEKRMMMKPFLCIGLRGSFMILCTCNGGCAICVNPSVKSSLFWSQGQLYGMILKEPGLEGFAGSWRQKLISQ